MLKINRLTKMVVSLSIVASIFVSALAAGAVFEPQVKTLKTQTKSTPYGVLTGRIEVVFHEWQPGHGSDLEFHAYSTINSSSPMDEMSTQISCVYNDTGLAPADNWSSIDSARNTKSCSTWVHIFPTDENMWKDIAVFSAHQVIGTNAYVLNMSTVYDPHMWGSP